MSSSERDFEIEDYEEFYTNHDFVEVSEGFFTDVHEYLPRFGWGFDTAKKLKPKSVLDIGCLDGSFLLTLAYHLGIKGTGIDLAKKGIDLGKLRAKNMELDVKFHQGKAEQWLTRLAVCGKSFDMITAFEILEHVIDDKKFLSLIDGVLAPGGTVLISTPDFDAPTFGKDDEQNKCHLRLYTLKDDDFEEVNKYGTMRKATSLPKLIGKQRIKESGVYSELINLRYE